MPRAKKPAPSDEVREAARKAARLQREREQAELAEARSKIDRTSGALTVLRDNEVSDGCGGFFAKGDKIDAADAEAAASLKAKGLVE